VPGAVALPDVADPAPDRGGVGPYVVPGDDRRARRRGEQRREHAQAGRLPRPVRPEERDQLALLHVEVDPADGLDELLLHLEVPGQPTDVDHNDPPYSNLSETSA
jgi:hypothetical protein